MSTNVFEAIYKKLPDYIRGGESNVFSEKSVLWEDLFGQRDGATEDSAESAMKNFLSPQSRQATGTAAWHMDNSPVVLDYIDDKLDADLFSQFDMPLAGNPATFEFRDKTVSMPFLWRFLTFQKAHETLNHLENRRYLDIVEIGAGYGCVANLWLQTGRVRSYTIVDLPENLVNSAYYLSESHPDWSIGLVEDNLGQPAEGSVNLLTPSHIRKVLFSGFNIAINSDSLGEMPKDTAQAYVDWLSTRLADGGVFFTKNGHRRGYDNFGVPQVSEYGYDKFRLMQFEAGNYCTSAFDDFSHIAILQKSATPGEPADRRIMDLLANLYATGLSSDLNGISKRFVADSLTQDDLQFLSACEDFFARREMQKVPEQYEYLRSYLIALRKGSRAQNNIDDVKAYLEKAQSDNAIVYCSMFWKFFREPSSFCGPDVPAMKLYSREFDEFDQNSALLRTIKYRLRFAVIDKKIIPYRPVHRSKLMMIKNIFLNLREKRQISVYR